MRDHHVLGRDAFFSQQVELLQGQFAPVSRMSDDRAARLAMSTCGGTEDSLGRWCDVATFSADLADESGTDSGVPNAIDDFVNKSSCERNGHFLEDVVWVHHLAVPARTHDDIDS